MTSRYEQARMAAIYGFAALAGGLSWPAEGAAHTEPPAVQRPQSLDKQPSQPTTNPESDRPDRPGAGGDPSPEEASPPDGPTGSDVQDDDAQPIPAPRVQDEPDDEGAPPDEAEAQPEETDETHEPARPASEAPSPGEPSPAGTRPEAPEDEPEAELEPELLAPSEEAPPRPRRRPPPATSAQPEPDLRSRYRIPGNPTRLQLTARGLYTNAGSRRESVGGGRLGGVTVDVGQSWNVMGYAVTASALGGSVSLANATTLHGLFGLGPTLTLGRTAMVGRGFLDLRAGYDFYFASAEGGELAPHGPRVTLDIGLLTAGKQRFWHGFGITIGYQPLIGTFRGDMPLLHMMSAGIVYWLG